MRLSLSVPAILLVLGNAVLAFDDLGCVCMQQNQGVDAGASKDVTDLKCDKFMGKETGA
ncbi:hypothetical protein PTT_08723 [Pyrenophora teres f. teres 0-1]|uniref:Uncharacterized protein n=1 Tax=Pyrenophora teres f. teres (strain 0-1) TaxID=861557 RepID=E3RKG2_PYRTT|nr:hypothetical protein PTT_08723 [Pyrenophora teres f. teres 0-1]